jgi:hypothetical protein
MSFGKKVRKKMLKPDLQAVTYFLDLLDHNARHTIASEHPTARNGLPKWEAGCTYEPEQRRQLIDDIVERQSRGSNVYYSVNRPCKVTQRQGAYGKNNLDDIIAIRALAFDIDTLQPQEEVIKLIKENLNEELTPSLIIFTGGGYHLIYLLNELINVRLHRPPENDEQKRINDIIIYNRSAVTQLAHDFEALLRIKFPNFKVDNMSNIDRVMRQPGTINHPKLEKQEKGQIPALSRILVENPNRTDIHKLRDIVPKQSELRPETPKKPFVSPKNSKWTGYLKAEACCEFIRDNHLADSNEWYTLHVMLPLIGAIHDSNKANQITLEEAEELFMMAISGGERFGIMCRGPGYFMRQWKSHRPELARNGTKSLGGLIYSCKEAGMVLPWADHVVWEESFKKQLRELIEDVQIVSEDIISVVDNQG